MNPRKKWMHGRERKLATQLGVRSMERKRGGGFRNYHCHGSHPFPLCLNLHHRRSLLWSSFVSANCHFHCVCKTHSLSSVPPADAQIAVWLSHRICSQVTLFQSDHGPNGGMLSSCWAASVSRYEKFLIQILCLAPVSCNTEDCLQLQIGKCPSDGGLNKCEFSISSTATVFAFLHQDCCFLVTKSCYSSSCRIYI